MGFKMKGSPAKLGTIQGTSGHASALKAAMDDKFKMPKPKMSTTTAHGQMSDAQAEFKTDQEMYNKAMGKKGKTAEDYMKEGFSQIEADQMEKDGGVSGDVDAPNKFLTKASRAAMKEKRAFKKEARAERKQMSKDAKADRKDARKARVVKRQAEKTASKKAKLDERTRRASMTRAEKKAERAEAKSAKKAAKAETRKARAASFKEKAGKFLDDVAYGQALQQGDASMIAALRKKKDHDPTASKNKLPGDNNKNQNKTAGLDPQKSKAKTSKSKIKGATPYTKGMSQVDVDMSKVKGTKQYDKVEDRKLKAAEKRFGKMDMKSILDRQNKGGLATLRK